MGDASWWLKIARAREHLVEFEEQVAAYLEREPYAVGSRLEGEGKRGRWVQRLQEALGVGRKRPDPRATEAELLWLLDDTDRHVEAVVAARDDQAHNHSDQC